MTDSSQGETPTGEDRPVDTARYYKRDFWSEENLKFSRPHYRLEKASRIINKIADGKECDLLDVGCGPAALQYLVGKNINYYGIDIAIHSPALNLLEADILESPIKFGDREFDIILAQGVFEYVGELQDQKFSEIGRLLKGGGKFVVSYVNFDHRNREMNLPFSNVQPLATFKESLARHFRIIRSYPSSHNWRSGQPQRQYARNLQLIININIPVISPLLAVEYFFICSSQTQ